VPGPWILPWRDTRPRIAPDAFVAPGASVIGDVVIGSGSAVFFGCVLRGDVWNIRIGQRSNLQDNSVVHVTTGGPGTSIGDEVTVGHGCILHACTIQDRGFVGMGSLLMDDAVVESDAMLAAGSLLTSGRRVCGGQLWAGRPAKYVRELTPEEIESIRSSAERYAQLAQAYLETLRA
jgi:carbonic anhydrase/acetyltransferase-like protein (isoleucine patch superfamily)